MDQQLLERVDEKRFLVRYALDGRTYAATIGMVFYDAELARATIADRLGMGKDAITVMSHRQLAVQS